MKIEGRKEGRKADGNRIWHITIFKHSKTSQGVNTFTFENSVSVPGKSSEPIIR
jgi:hypothetical protein